MGLLTRLAGTPAARKLMVGAARSRAAYFRSLDPRKAQRDLFHDLIRAARSTRFGTDYDFARIAGMPFEKAYDEFRTIVPIRTYQQFWADYCAGHHTRSADGSISINLHDITWPGQIRRFCETSGTTAPTKFIPFSREMFAQNRRAALDLISCYLDSNHDSKIIGGKILYMSGSTALNRMAPGVVSGDMSAITLRYRPWYLAPFVEPSLEIADLPWASKLDAMARLLLRDSSIRAISGVPPWIILLLTRCRELGGGRSLPELLPNLELIIHGGTGISPYLAEFHRLFNDSMPRLIELLPSSEAFMGFQCAGDTSMRLTPYYGTFFEFVRFEDLGDDGKPAADAPAIPLEQVVTGQRYAVILTTCSGLWRYHIGDTIRFTALSPLLIEFAGRDRVLDKLEEKVTQEEVEQAVADYNRNRDGRVVREFMVGSDIAGRRHVWILAGRGLSHDRQNAALRLDASLSERNADYACFRSQGRIAPPRVVVTDEDTIYRWSDAERGKLGGQSKIPRIDATVDASLVNSIIRFASRAES